MSNLYFLVDKIREKNWQQYTTPNTLTIVILLLFIPATTANSDFAGFLSQISSITLFSYLNSWERASISLFNVECSIRELLVPFLKRLWYDVVLDWGLNPGPPALEASTLPLGYRGDGGLYKYDTKSRILFIAYHVSNILGIGVAQTW